MAIYYCKTSHIQRATGRSSVAAAAYRTGVKLRDIDGKIHDYTRKKGVLYTELLTPHNLPIDREALWQDAEKVEVRSNARVAREILLALPHELDRQQQKRLVQEYAQKLVDRYGVAVDIAIHEPSKDGDERNIHAHLLLTTRKLERLESGRVTLTAKSDLELSDRDLRKKGLAVGKEQIEQMRENWATACNRSLILHGQAVDHRSYERQKIDKKPQIHEGTASTQARRRGQDTARTLYNDYIKASNDLDQIMNMSKSGSEFIQERDIEQTQRRIGYVQNDIDALNDKIKYEKDKIKAYDNVGNIEKMEQDLAHQYFDKDKKMLIAQAKEVSDHIQELGKNKPLFFGKQKWQEQLEKAQKQHAQIKKAFDDLKVKGVTKNYIEKAKEQLKSQYPIEYEILGERDAKIKSINTRLDYMGHDFKSAMTAIIIQIDEKYRNRPIEHIEKLELLANNLEKFKGDFKVYMANLEQSKETQNTHQYQAQKGLDIDAFKRASQRDKERER